MGHKINKRPYTKFHQSLADEICETIASTRKGIRKLCEENENWPDPAQIFRWLNTNKSFCDQYAQAKENQVEVNIDYLQELIDEPHRYINDKGIEVIDVAMIRTKVDAIKWHVGKLKPKKYGLDNQEESSSKESQEEIRRRYHEQDEINKKEF